MTGSDEQHRAFLDTGAQWGILPGDIAKSAGIDVADVGLGEARMRTRLVTIRGSFERLPVDLVAEDGDDLMVDATWFVSADWCGPIVLGWKGGLERFCWGINPGRDRFHFGEREDD